MNYTASHPAPNPQSIKNLRNKLYIKEIEKDGAFRAVLNIIDLCNPGQKLQKN
jgi:hypothetical protein